ncbi:MAG: hypothetical protein NWE95_02535 [Candidatus Bathyarchaeota archaeon]|nr:hypothetical protein [Candidatus Bathyarchaeota archaeon]
MSKKVVLVIVLMSVLLVSAIAAVYYTQFAPPRVDVGVKVGDTFTYSLQGTCILIGLDAVEPAGFSSYNQTDYYKVTITGINGTSVTMDTVWRFKNGTEVITPQTIDLANGAKTDEHGFWAIYAANLNLNNAVRPTGYDGVVVNDTDTKTYTSGTRDRNFFSTQGNFYDINDPTQSTWRIEYTGIYFDKQTGMLETLTNIQEYNNPQYRLIITWKLVSSSVWGI